MDFTIDYETLTQMSKADIRHFHCGGDIYVENDDFLLKAMRFDLNKMVTYLKNIPDHENIIKPIEHGEILYPEDLDIEYKTLYRMKYLKEAKTLLSLYNEKIPYEKKIEYGKQLFQALQFLHQYIVIGDIHFQNILISQDKAYLTDLDNSKKVGSIFQPIYCYYYVNFFEKYGNSKYTDVLKLYIELLSFILGLPLSESIFRHGYPWFYEVLQSLTLPDEVRSFFDLRKKEFSSLGEEAYDFERYMTPDVLELKPKLNILR